MYKRKLFFFGLISTFILLIALGSAALSAHLTRENLQQSQIAQSLLTEHLQLSSVSYRLFKQLTDELLFGRNANQAKVRNKQQLITQALNRIRELEIVQREALGKEVTAGSIEDTAQLGELLETIIEEFNSITAVNLNEPLGQQARVQALLEDTIDNQFREAINAAVARQTRVVTTINTKIETLNTAIVWVTIGLGLLTGPFIIAGCYWLFNALYQPLIVLRTGTDAIAAGNYNYRLPETLDSEFSDLVKALNGLVERLAEHEAKAQAHRKQLTYEVAQRTRELTEANRLLTTIDARRRQFIADISHELRTPLTIIRGEAQVTLRQRTLSKDDYRATLNAILNQSVNLSRLVDDMLLLIRAEMNQLQLEPATVKLSRLIQDQILSWKKVYASREISFRCHLVNEQTMSVDKQRVSQVIAILLENALKYSGPDAPVSVSLEAKQQGYAVVIKDSGDGISPSDQAQIFERFVRLRGTGSGLGLGLPIAKAIVEAHHGTIDVASEVGHGARFTVYLPFTKDVIHEDIDRR
ncbi:sensor histidine kinase [Salinimonas chungwhensis]|uniref:sensor histidine kinase n=1 Tax=Salinimonas chungwhensis TaxID=265425 RepID=UPI0003A5C6BB|nr:HAMP domain-containing sensor histidine kinase [Salinimonas chungwhensis]